MDEQQRYRMVVAYRGTRYHGWQQQAMSSTWKGEPPAEGQGIPTVQEILRRAVASVVGHPVNVVGSSRTDAAVHAKGQVAHFDTSAVQIPVEGLRKGINSKLPPDIEVRRLEAVPANFDAIKSTISKRYQYLVWNSPDRPVFFEDLAWHRGLPLDIAAMREAARRLEGEHDFTSFARPGHGRTTTIRIVHECSVSQRGKKVILAVAGNGFLWNQVRIMVGTLVQVGLGKIAPEEIDAMLAAKDRRLAGPTAPPHGLYLQWIVTAEETVRDG